ncbi:MAG: arginine N-succinyltransferase [Phycisphaerales bacterium]|nr:arginine N-succinyltransferase [Phycisphaerales bacterium]
MPQSSPQFVIRRAMNSDLPTLHKLSKMVHFINLPPDQEIIADKIRNSRQSFLRAARDAKTVHKPKNQSVSSGLSEKTAMADIFMFVIEELNTEGCIGTSQVVSQMGGPGHPNVCFKLETREKYAEDLKFGTKHTVARVYLDESGPSELGGLIMQPSFRGHKLKLGKFTSLVRFHFIALHRKMFRPTILAELMAPITSKGESLVWDTLGRRFIPLSYDEADRFCQYSRNFMTDLLPEGDIHLSLLPPQARAQVGEVGPETVPARRMLERLGFEYHGFVDPFDGGPYITAKTDEIEIVKNTFSAMLGPSIKHEQTNQVGIVSVLNNDGDFRAVQCAFQIDRSGKIRVTSETFIALRAEPGMTAGCTPMRVPIEPGRGENKRKTAKKSATKKVAKKSSKKTTKKSTKKTTKRVSRSKPS